MLRPKLIRLNEVIYFFSAKRRNAFNFFRKLSKNAN